MEQNQIDEKNFQSTNQTNIETLVEKKNYTRLILFIVVILIVVLSSTTFYFLTKQKKVEIVEKETEIPLTPSDLRANIFFASTIRKDTTYDVQPNAEYLEGDIVFLHVDVFNFKQTKEFKVDVSEDIEITDAENKIVFSKLDFVRYNSTENETITYIRLSNALPTLDLKPGSYFVNLKVKDNIAGNSVVKSGKFKIIERSKETIEQIADISGIVSSDLSQTKLIREQIVWGPNGNIISELTVNETIFSDLSKIDLKNIDASIKIPERYDEGNYTVEIKYINLANGMFVSYKNTVEVIKKLEISDLIFAKSIDENYVYEPNFDASYQLGSKIFVYIKIVDFAQPFVNNKYNVKFSEDIYIYDSNYNLIALQKDYLKVDDMNDEKKDSYNIKNMLDPFDFTPGKYIYKVVVNDLNNGQKAEKEAVFYIV